MPGSSGVMSTVIICAGETAEISAGQNGCQGVRAGGFRAAICVNQVRSTSAAGLPSGVKEGSCGPPPRPLDGHFHQNMPRNQGLVENARKVASYAAACSSRLIPRPASSTQGSFDPPRMLG